MSYTGADLFVDSLESADAIDETLDAALERAGPVVVDAPVTDR